MKNYEHPEFFIFNKLNALAEKYTDHDDIIALKEDVRKIINENSIFIVQTAMTYALLGDQELYPETKAKLKELYENALKLLDQ